MFEAVRTNPGYVMATLNHNLPTRSHHLCIPAIIFMHNFILFNNSFRSEGCEKILIWNNWELTIANSVYLSAELISVGHNLIHFQ